MMNIFFNNKLIKAINHTNNKLNLFAQEKEVTDLSSDIFGDTLDIDRVLSWLKETIDPELPSIEIVPQKIINHASVGYSEDNNTIYLAREFLDNNNIEDIGKVLLEEIGHYTDSRFNSFQSFTTPGTYL